MSIDNCCSIVPYFKVSPENMAAFKALCQEAVVKTKEEKGCLYYGYSFDGDSAHCREGFQDAEAVLAHVANVEGIFREMLSTAEIERFEIHGPEA